MQNKNNQYSNNFQNRNLEKVLTRHTAQAEAAAEGGYGAGEYYAGEYGEPEGYASPSGVASDMYENVDRWEYHHSRVDTKNDALEAARAMDRREFYTDIDMGDVDFSVIDGNMGVSRYGNASAAANLMNGGNVYSAAAPDVSYEGGLRRERHKKTKKKVRYRKTAIAVAGVVVVVLLVVLIAANVINGLS